MSQDPLPELFRQRIQAASEQQLESLDLRNSPYVDKSQKLTRIPDEVFELTHLKKLDLSNNNLQEIPSQISRLTNLESLDLIGNYKLTDIPEELLGFLRSILLKLSWQVHTPIPEWFGQIKQLGLHLIESGASARIKSRETIPDTIVHLENLFWLRISIKFSEDWLPWLQTLEQLEIDLTSNQLTTLPESITKLSNLTRLYLSSNQLTTLSESITKLSNLTRLYLSGNQLTTLPESITNLSNLTELYLISNQLTTLPKSITHLSNLAELYLSYNQLTTLPKSITKLSNLTRLDLSSNQLITLPESLTKLSNLTRLDLRNNQLTTLPESLTKLSNLTSLCLDDNPLETPPLEIAEKGIEAIREYFRQLREEGTDYIYEAKLLIVGEAGAGKTTLAKKIEDPDYQLDSHEKSTEGIDITKWSFSFFDKEQKEQEFKVNIWDFGGQEIYHATHQFFLTKRSLYTLVVDNRKEDDNLYYWLNVVELLSDNSPLLIIKNQKQNRHREINQRALRGQFDNLEKTLSTNLATNEGLDNILTQIKPYLSNLEHIGSALPKTWVKVRQALEDDERNHLSLEKYIQICQNNGFTQLKDKLQLSGYLHDLGVCLHFQDQEDSLLYKTVILKPEWGTDAVYKALDNPKVINNQGCFTRDDLKNIWHEDQYALMRGELLELMKKFQLCYEIPDSKDSFIAPQLLSDNQPDYDWDESHNLILHYTYPNFMPKGIISRFIVIMHQYIHSHNQHQCVWKTGVILEQDNTLAEVIEYYGKREIIIRVVGNNKRGFMAIVAHELDKINNSYPRLNYQKLIPCNCPTCIDDKNPYGYDFNNLLTRINDRKYTVECNKKPYYEVQILSLIDKSIDMQKLLSQLQKDKNQDINVQGNIQQLIFRYIAIQEGNYNEQIEKDYIQGNYTDSRRTQNIKAETLNAEGAASFSLGDISSTVANTINQLPSFDNEPPKQELKELLIQLQTAVLETDLDTEDKQETLEQINSIAIALQNPQDSAMKKASKKAMKGLGGTAFTLPSDSPMIAICKQLSEAIEQVF